MQTDKKNIFRCYLYAYLNEKRTNEYIAIEHGEYKRYSDFKLGYTVEHLLFYGMPEKRAWMVARVARRLETPLSLLLLIVSFFKTVFRCLTTRKEQPKGKVLSLKLNMPEQRYMNLYKSAGISDYLTIDIPEQATKYTKVPKLSVFSNLNLCDLYNAFAFAFRMIFFMKKKYGKNDCLFRSYSSYTYFLVYRFLQKTDNSNKLVYYSTFDRWAYLHNMVGKEVIWVQHGKLTDKIYYKRIKGVKEAYYISPVQRDICERFLFGDKPVAKYRKLFDYSGEDKLKKNGSKDVLVICYAGAIQKQEKAVKSLYGRSVNIYMKPHPYDDFSIYTNFQMSYPNIVILEKFDFPKVDYVISYDSTLADEYEMHDIPVLRYEDSDFEEKLFKI